MRHGLIGPGGTAFSMQVRKSDQDHGDKLMRRNGPFSKVPDSSGGHGLDTAIRIHEPMFTETFIHSLIHRGILFLCPGFALCQALGTWQDARQGANLWEREPTPCGAPQSNSTAEWEKPLWSQAHNLTTSERHGAAGLRGARSAVQRGSGWGAGGGHGGRAPSRGAVYSVWGFT